MYVQINLMQDTTLSRQQNYFYLNSKCDLDSKVTIWGSTYFEH